MRLQAFGVLIVLMNLVACTRTTSEHRYDAVAPGRVVIPGEACPDLSGTFLFDGGAVASRYFLGDAPAAHQPTAIRIDMDPGNTNYPFQTSMSRDQLRQQTDALMRRDEAAYGQWRQQVLALTGAQTSLDRIRLEQSVAAVGPIPTRSGALSRGRCEDYWMRLAVLDVAAYADVADSQSAGHSDLELWAGRDAGGALLLRFDRYSLRAAWLTGRDLRTTRRQHFVRLPMTDADNFVWNLEGNDLPDPAPPKPEFDLAARADALAALNRRVLALLPEGALLDGFEPNEAATPAMREAPQLTFPLKGSARSNRDISEFLRSLTQEPDIRSVELVSIRSEDARMVFEIQMKWQQGAAD